MRLHHKRKGFSLVEVLAALLLVSIVVPVVMHGFDVTNSMATLARQRTEAAALGDSKLNELVATGDWKLGITSGDFPDHPQYRWMAEQVGWSSSSLVELDLHVIWTWRGVEHQFVVSTLVEASY